MTVTQDQEDKIYQLHHFTSHHFRHSQDYVKSFATDTIQVQEIAVTYIILSAKFLQRNSQYSLACQKLA